MAGNCPSPDPVATALEPPALQRWLAARRWQLFDFQRDAARAWLDGRSGLIHSATGSGKTLAAVLGPVLQALAQPARPRRHGRTAPLTLVWVTPLRSLATDLAGNLQTLVTELGLDWSVGLRTGDTTASERARQRRRLPTLLVTTPESLSLLLSWPDTVRQLDGLQSVVVDEWHELLGNKRGVLLELTLAALRARSPELRAWGLSATLANLEQAMQVLLGPGHDGQLVASGIQRQVQVETLIPETLDRFPWSGHIGLRQLDAVADAIAGSRSTLVCCNTRFQAETWFDALLRHRLDWVDRMALHHGSLESATRQKVETLLRGGHLKCVVATSSLDLGVDFAPVDQVIQIGGPKGIARLLQRAGRSGHSPGLPARLVCAPGHALEMLEYAAARRAIAAGRIEPRLPLRQSLDVLAQHVVTRVLGAPASAADLLKEVRATYAFQQLQDSAWEWVLTFLRQGGQALAAYPEYRRLERDSDGCLHVPDRRVARRHRMMVGTITSDAAVSVQWRSGGRIGVVEESFISRLRPGDRFMFGGRVLELVAVRDLVAQVKRANSVRGAIPRWAGGRLPLSSELADGVLALLEAFAGGECPEPELEALAPLLQVQQRWSALPARDLLVAEQIRSRDGHHLFLYPFAGRLVHEGLAALLAWRLGQTRPITFTTSVNDYGLELLAPEPWPLDSEGLRQVLTPEGLLEDVLACINAAELGRRRFRDIARITGLVFAGYPGRGKGQRQIQASAGLIHDVLARHEPDSLLLEQARREVLEQELEAGRLRAVLERAGRQRIVICTPERLTPLAFPLWAARTQTRLSTETGQQRVARMLAQLERAAG